MKKRWKVSPANKKLQDFLARELDILPLTAQLLINRGLVDGDRALSFLTPALNDLHDPYLMKDMDPAVTRIVEAVTRGEKIALYGDYDVDGTTATALLHLFFKELGVHTLAHIPERLSEGYGLNTGAVKGFSRAGVKVIITADCGVSNHDEVNFARSLGIDCIITDHHEISGEPPSAHSILNPKQTGCDFPFKGLAGVGVAFNLVIALRARLREMGWFKNGGPNLKSYLDLLCIGTVADMVPLLDENRIFVSYGLSVLEGSERPGLRALKEVAGVKPGRLNSEAIAFQLAPRINAAGRLHSASTAFRLFVTDDEKEAMELARMLDGENTSRQRLEGKILEEALSMLEEEDGARAIVLSSGSWHPGVVGIVASRLAERFTKPTVMIAVDDGKGIGRGSVRGIKGFNVLEGLKACEDFLERYGGHKAAAGLTVRKENIEGFMDAFIDFFNRTLTDDDLVPEVELDALVSLDEIDSRVVAEIERLSPFGRSNRQPLLGATDAHVLRTEVVGRGHLRLVLRHNGCERRAIGFGLADMHPVKGGGFDIAFYPYMDKWRGSTNLRLKIKDLQPST
jgi:single-stranded-DNA-specific exonuclease